MATALAPAGPLDLVLDPLRFVGLCWPDMRLYDKQAEVLLSLRDNIETDVHAATGVGKTRIAAVAILWFFASRTPARVVTTSSSNKQLEKILWGEIRSLYRQSKYRLPFKYKHLEMNKFRADGSNELEELDYIVGHVTNEVENFQGHHLPRDIPRVLGVFEEASGIPDEYKDAADSWAHRLLAIGNPLSVTNFFYRDCKEGSITNPSGKEGLMRKVIHIDGRDSPNVQLALKMKEAGNHKEPPILIDGILTHDEFVQREKLWDEVKKETRLYGRFHEGDQTLLYPMAWLDASQDRWSEVSREQRTATAMGVDVAGGGRDKTVWTIIDSQGIIEQIVKDTPNTMEICGVTIRRMEQYHLRPSQVAVDASGLGEPIVDRLHEQGHHVLGVGFGESASDKTAYKNRRAEMYGTLRAVLSPDREGGVFAIPSNAHELRQELAVLPLKYDSEGKLHLPPKEARSSADKNVTLRKLLGRSPDRADSLVLACWANRSAPRIASVDLEAVAELDEKLVDELDFDVDEVVRQLGY